MLKISTATSTEDTGSTGFSLAFHGVDDEQRQWRLIVIVSCMFGFGGLFIDLANEHGEFRSDLPEEEAEGYPAPVETDLQDALRRVDLEFARLGQSEWTRVYTDHYQKLVDEYQRFRATVENKRPLEEYDRSKFVQARRLSDEADSAVGRVR